MRLGWIGIDLECVVDLDNEEMVKAAENQMAQSLWEKGLSFYMSEKEDKYIMLEIDSIPDFLHKYLKVGE